MSIPIGPRSNVHRGFSVQLGNYEGARDIKRNYETRVVINPIDIVVSDSDSSSGTYDDIDSIQSDLPKLEIALENLDCSTFKKILFSDLVYQSNDFQFEQPQFNFWYDSGVIEIALKSEVDGIWNIITRFGVTSYVY